MSKIYKLFVDENIKTWKKFSTKLAIILIVLALLGALSLSKLLQYIDEKNDINSERFVSSSEEGFKGEIEILKEQLQDNTLSKSEKEEIERQIKIYEIRIKNQIYRTDWRSEALSDTSIDDKTLEIVEKNDFDGGFNVGFYSVECKELYPPHSQCNPEDGICRYANSC